MILIFQIIGALVRYFISFIINKTIHKKLKNFDYFFKDRGNEVIFNSTNDYINSFVGFVAFSILLIIGFLLFG